MRPIDIALWACVPGGLAWLLIVDVWARVAIGALEVLDEVMHG